jgi:hypothetical protein
MFVKDQDLLLDDYKHLMVVHQYLHVLLSMIDDHVHRYHDLIEDLMIGNADGMM